MLVLVTYVPDGWQEKVKNALFLAGAGKKGYYDMCSWQTLGQGQFRPLEKADPFLGTNGQVETVKEWRLEMILEEEDAEKVVNALKEAHPYEEVAYHLLSTFDPKH